MSDPLDPLRARYTAHPLWENRWWALLATGPLDVAGVRWMMQQNYLYVRSFGQTVAAVAMRADDEVRALLARELWQEGGSGDPAARFPERFRRMLREALDIANPDDGAFAVRTRCFLDESLASCRNEDPVYALAALVFGHLAPMARVRDAIGKGMRVGGIAEAHLGLFQSASQSDSVRQLECALASSSSRPGWLATCERAIDDSLDQRDRYFESLYVGLTDTERETGGQRSEVTSGARDERERLGALLGRAPLFSDFTHDERQTLQALMRRVCFRRGELIFRQGAAADDGMYVIDEGEVEVSRRVPGDEEVLLGRLSQSEVLGEMALTAPRYGRSASARAASDVIAYVLDERVFEGLLALLRPPSLKLLRQIGLLLCQRLRKRYAQLSEGRTPTVVALPAAHVDTRPLVATDLPIAHLMLCFQRLDKAELAELSGSFRYFEAPRGHVLFDGDAAGAYYVALRGAIELSIHRGDRPLRLAILGPGKAVAHAGLFEDGPCGSVAVVREDATLAVLPRAAVRGILERNDRLALRVLEMFNESVAGAIRRTDMLLAHATTSLAR